MLARVEGARWIIACAAVLEKMQRATMACVSGRMRYRGVLKEPVFEPRPGRLEVGEVSIPHT